MKTLAIALTGLIGLGMAGMGASEAQAASPFGVYIGSGGVRVNVGRSHYGGHSYHGSSYRGRYSRGHYDYHDTTHLDYHRGGYTRHGNHYDYSPGHWNVHRTGHYDYHRGSHGRRGHR